MKIYIYKITSPEGKVYIGQTSRFRDRLLEHRKSDHPIGAALRRFGVTNCRIEVIWTTIDPQLANHLEEAAIQLFDCITPKGYNQTIGGQRGSRGYHHTEEARKHLSENRKKWFDDHPGWKFQGHSEESKKKISEAMKLKGGHLQTPETREKIGAAKRGKKRDVPLEEHMRRSASASGDNNPMRRRKLKNAAQG